MKSWSGKKKCVVGVTASFAVLTILGVATERHALACEFVPGSGFERISRQLYVEPGISTAQLDSVRENVASAHDRIQDVYGSPESAPRFLIASTAEKAGRWGANETASMHRLPDSACIVVGPKGQNADVLAHEWLHAEIQHRVGFWRFLREIPTWFDEGVALTVDYREPFLPENIQLPDKRIADVRNLTSGRAFFSGITRTRYQAARLAVEPLIHDGRLFSDLERVGGGASFDAVFQPTGESADGTVP